MGRGYSRLIERSATPETVSLGGEMKEVGKGEERIEVLTAQVSEMETMASTHPSARELGEVLEEGTDVGIAEGSGLPWVGLRPVRRLRRMMPRDLTSLTGENMSRRGQIVLRGTLKTMRGAKKIGGEVGDR